jgi:carboxylesterase type B
MLELAESTVVATRAGRVRGVTARGIHAFRGVPYAAPPFGPNRLRPPQPAEPWTGTRDASADGPVPIQLTAADGPAAGFVPDGPAPGEDCLNLNVWTPALGAAQLPVIVWITGGSFQFGAAGWYDGSRFARDGVVLVSINYRPGCEGFLHLRDAVPDRGLLDQVAALRWVHDNITAFGGDPGTVTVCGESAGAMSIGALLALPDARGLFHRAILQSGAAHHVLPDTTALQVGDAVATQLGVAPSLDAMADVPPDRLLAAHEQV